MKPARKTLKSARFVSFREDDGSFRFRLLDAEGEQLLLSEPFADGKTAGQISKRLQSGAELDVRRENSGFTLWLEGACVASSPLFDDEQRCEQAIRRLRESLAAQD